MCVSVCVQQSGETRAAINMFQRAYAAAQQASASRKELAMIIANLASSKREIGAIPEADALAKRALELSQPEPAVSAPGSGPAPAPAPAPAPPPAPALEPAPWLRREPLLLSERALARAECKGLMEEGGRSGTNEFKESP